jgi:hypothetical protein
VLYQAELFPDRSFTSIAPRRGGGEAGAGL